MLPTLTQRLDRIPAAAFELFRRALSFDAWGLFWIVAVAALVFALKGDRWTTAVVALTAALLQSAAYVVTYAISPWILADIAGSSANRLLLHLVGCGAIVLAAAAPRSPNPGFSSTAPSRS